MIYLQRQETQTTQYFCMHCQSFFHRSGYQENDEARKNDVGWLVAHPGDFSHLIAELRGLFPNARSCFEAGCGIGHLLSQLKAAGYHARGVDSNARAIQVARDKYGVDAEAGYFREGMARADLLFAIDVLEHLEEPRTFFAAMLASLNPGGAIVVRVPCVNRDLWPYLHGADERKKHEPMDPFMDNSVHITHFSSRGMELMAESLGAKLVARQGKEFFVFTWEGAAPGRRRNGQGPWHIFGRLHAFARRVGRRCRLGLQGLRIKRSPS